MDGIEALSEIAYWKERGREEGEELSASLQEKARELAPEKAATTSLSSLTDSTER